MPEAENPNPPPPPPWFKLPDDVKANILHRLCANEILDTVQNVCTDWRRVCSKDPSMWRVVHLWDVEFGNEKCRRAVDLSQGQLIDLHLEDFGTDDLLMYISERCNLLKRLTLVCTRMSCKGVAEASRKFPELEYLLVYLVPLTAEDIERTPLTAEHIEIIGTSCPKLKEFTNLTPPKINPMRIDAMDVDRNGVAVDKNGVALAIAKNMSNLHRLRLGDGIGNEGLEAILNSCPHLESLVINVSQKIDLSGDLGK